MSATVIKDFLVALGFKSDSSGAKKMDDDLQRVEVRVKLLQKVFTGLAISTVLAVAKTSNELEKLYYASKRVGSSADNIRAYGNAISQMGGDAGAALQTLESLSQKMRQSPGYEKMVQGIGVATRDSTGAMRDRVEVMKDLSAQFKGMEYYQANARASALGIDENTLMAMRDPAFLQNMEKYQKLQKSMGMNDGLAKAGKDFAVEWRDLMMTSKSLAEVIIMTAGKALIPVFKTLNRGLQGSIVWFGKLDPRVKSFLAMGLKIGTLIVVFVGLFSVISKLSMVLPILKSLLFLFKALNLAFLRSPIGIVLALAAAIALLWDDYNNWKEGGKSLIDWSLWEPGINKAREAITDLIKRMELLIKAGAAVASGDFKTARKLFDQMRSEDPWEQKAPPRTVSPTKPAALPPPPANTAVSGALPRLGAAVNSMGKGFSDTVAQTGVAPIKQGAKGEKQVEFIRKYWGMAVRIAAAMGVTPELILSQFAAETDWGRKTVPGTNNLGNIKANATWQGKTVKAYDKIEGSYDPYKVYETPEDFADDYIKLVGKSPRYKNVRGAQTPEKFFSALKNAGYATDKKYVEKGIKMHSSVVGRLDNTKLLQNKEQAKFETPKTAKGLAHFAQNADAPGMTNPTAVLLPSGYSTGSSSKNVTITQSHKTDIVINGAESPQATANRIKRHEENVSVQMAKNARSIVE